MTIERRFVTGSVELRKAAEGGPARLFGYGSVFNSRSKPMPSFDGGNFVEEIAPGAFDELLASNPDVIATLLDHEGLLARTSAGTMRLGVDQHGLWYEVDLPDTQAARDLAVHVARGDVRGSSFGFRVAEDGEERRLEGVDTVVRTITKVSYLRDVGPVVNPAYDATDVSLRAIEQAKVLLAGKDQGFPGERLRRQLEVYKKPY